MGLSIENREFVDQALSGGLKQKLGEGGIAKAIATPGRTGYLEVFGTLTQAQLISMFTTPIVLVPAPGLTLAHVIDEVQFFHSYSTAAYSGGGDIAVGYPSIDEILFDVTLVTAGTSTRRIASPTRRQLDATTGTGIGVDIGALENLAIQISNKTAVFAAGNVDNVLKYRLVYHTCSIIS